MNYKHFLAGYWESTATIDDPPPRWMLVAWLVVTAWLWVPMVPFLRAPSE